MFRVGWCSLIAVWALLVWTADAQSAEQQLLIKVRICEGDPAGSVEQGTLKVLAAPTVVTRAAQQATVQVGGEVPLIANPQSADDYAAIGNLIELKPSRVADGRVRLDIKVSHSERVDPRGELPVAVETRSLQTVLFTKLGLTTKLAGSSMGAKQRWIEVTVEEANLAND